jgi:hypothetical protein
MLVIRPYDEGVFSKIPSRRSVLRHHLGLVLQASRVLLASIFDGFRVPEEK